MNNAPEKTEVTPESLREAASKIAQSAEYAEKAADRNRELLRAAELKKQADELEAAECEKLTPNRWELVGVIADDFDVTRETAEKWLIAEFGGK